MDQPSLSGSRIQRVRASFEAPKANGKYGGFSSHLQPAWVELGFLLSYDPFPVSGLPVVRARDLHRALGYLNSRLGDFLLRQIFVHWLRREFVQNTHHESELWPSFARLTVKDFHADVSSLMDAIGPVAILMDTDLKREDLKKLPGFPDIQSGTKRSYRSKLQPDLVAIIDSTDEWWPFVKEVRDVVLHRRHSRAVFADAQSGFLFQVYDGNASPLLLHKALSATIGTNVADFLLYSAWVTAEVFHLLDNLGSLLFHRLNVPAKTLVTVMAEGGFEDYLHHLDTLIERVDSDAECA